jgi:hypothetical protein
LLRGDLLLRPAVATAALGLPLGELHLNPSASVAGTWPHRCFVLVAKKIGRQPTDRESTRACSLAVHAGVAAGPPKP